MDRWAVSTFTVTNANDGGLGSLRQAILNANASPGADLIRFNLPTATRTIFVSASLPPITEAAIIDGTTQPGFAGLPWFELMARWHHPPQADCALPLTIVKCADSSSKVFRGTGLR